MNSSCERRLEEYVVRTARRTDIDGARSVMLDTFYHVFGHGYIPRWHADVIDPGTARPSHRRHGLARALVDLACRFVADTPGYDTIYLHTNAAVEGAEPFWRSLAHEIHDGRTDPRHSPAVHFEIPIPSRS